MKNKLLILLFILSVIILSSCNGKSEEHTEHQFTNYILGSQECGDNSIILNICELCGYSETQINKKDHDLKLNSTIEPVENKSIGYSVYTCQSCNKEILKDFKYIQNGNIIEYVNYNTYNDFFADCSDISYGTNRYELGYFHYKGNVENIYINLKSIDNLKLTNFQIKFPETVKNLFIEGNAELVEDVSIFFEERDTDVNVILSNVNFSNSKYYPVFVQTSKTAYVTFLGKYNSMIFTDSALHGIYNGGDGAPGNSAIRSKNHLVINCYSDLNLYGQNGGDGKNGDTDNTHYGSPIYKGDNGGRGGDGGSPLEFNGTLIFKVYDNYKVTLIGGKGGTGGIGGPGQIRGEDGPDGIDAVFDYDIIYY